MAYTIETIQANIYYVTLTGRVTPAEFSELTAARVALVQTHKATAYLIIIDLRRAVFPILDFGVVRQAAEVDAGLKRVLVVGKPMLARLAKTVLKYVSRIQFETCATREDAIARAQLLASQQLENR